MTQQTERMAGMRRYEDVSILLVEDNAGDSRLIREMIGETEYAAAKFRSVSTLSEAIDASHLSATVATVLLDLNLPDSDGIATLLSIKEVYGDSAIVVLTGLDDDRMVVETLRAGAQSYLTKNELNPSMLGRTLRYSIERGEFIKRLREADRSSMERDRRFRMLIEHSSDLNLLIGPDGSVRYASPTVRRVFGYPKDEELDLFNVVHPDDVPTIRSCMTRAMEHPAVTLPMLVRAKVKGGPYLCLEGTLNNLLAVAGVEGIVLNLHDVTERIAFEERMAFDRSNLDALINSTQDLVWSVDHDLRLITANEPFLEMMEKLLGNRLNPGDDLMSVPDLSGASPTEQWREQYMRALRGEAFQREEHMTSPVEIYNEINFSPIREGGRVVGVACFSRDVTARRQMEARLRRNETIMAQAQALAHFGSWELNVDDPDDPSAGPHSWSTEVYRIVGLEPGTVQVNLKTFLKTVHPEDQVRVRQALTNTMEHGIPYSLDHRILRPDGTIRWVHEDGALVMREGQRRVLGTIHDISERKAAEQALDKLNTELEDRVVERTQELLLVNEDLEQEVLKNQRLSNQLITRNEDLVSSSTYARRIQDALLPTAIDLPFFTGAACLSKPRDVVSGDFIWQLDTTDQLFFALADCTGHGVPGALMSMLGHSLLNQIVQDRRIQEPSMILANMDLALEEMFTQHRSDDPIQDGMDIGCLRVDKADRSLVFSGALIRCHVLRGQDLIRLDCSRDSLGGHVRHAHKKFEQHVLQLETGDRIILSSDGFQSQFGGPSLKKMKVAHMRDLLLRTASMPPSEAVALLDREFKAWMGAAEQVDDVLVVLLDV